MPDEPISLGPPRYYRPVCVRRKNGFTGGPAGYVKCDDPSGGPIIIDAEAQRLKAALWEHEYGSVELIDAVEAAVHGGVPGEEIDAILKEIRCGN